MLEDARKEAEREADMKYISILLHHGLSIEEIAKDAKLDKLYVEQMKSEIESKKKSPIESGRSYTKWEEVQHDDRVNPPLLIRFREYRRGFQTPHGHSPMPATLGRSGYLTTDTAQTQ